MGEMFCNTPRRGQWTLVHQRDETSRTASRR
jgi:hypothetical protein